MSEKQYLLPFEGTAEVADVVATVERETEMDVAVAAIRDDARDKAQQYFDESLVPGGGE